MAETPSLFEQACIAHGLDTPAEFIRAFEGTAALLAEPTTVTARQVRRW